MRGPVIEGEIARLRPIEPRDADEMWESLQDDEAMRLTGTTRSFTRGEIDAWAADVSDRPGRYDWAIVPAARRDGKPLSDRMIGEIVVNEIDPDVRSANLRLALLPNYRGRGYGRDAIFQVMRFVFDGTPEVEGPRLHRLGLDVLGFNPRARMLYESLGFREEGRQRDAVRDGDGWSDVVIMGILEDEFRASV
ncbi:GNAT family N-acetyltransferase [Luteimicrobium subarcticum]|uniref:RimJ/RimL family protein N-acetyltransferase n=1 Tax=Luteimicrobium subarcticum TaxID=620910 RepID=A0A2M8WQP1_9MICO|nr:GNAT family protein [Luteimicrobium subarcticum]PJI93214.1 RimJ/RimL family protein N-acetyltransferase [Luteimicrobium subarcticum]